MRWGWSTVCFVKMFLPVRPLSSMSVPYWLLVKKTPKLSSDVEAKEGRLCLAVVYGVGYPGGLANAQRNEDGD